MTGRAREQSSFWRKWEGNSVLLQLNRISRDCRIFYLMTSHFEWNKSKYLKRIEHKQSEETCTQIYASLISDDYTINDLFVHYASLIHGVTSCNLSCSLARPLRAHFRWIREFLNHAVVVALVCHLCQEYGLAVHTLLLDYMTGGVQGKWKSRVQPVCRGRLCFFSAACVSSWSKFLSLIASESLARSNKCCSSWVYHFDFASSYGIMNNWLNWEIRTWGIEDGLAHKGTGPSAKMMTSSSETMLGSHENFWTESCGKDDTSLMLVLFFIIWVSCSPTKLRFIYAHRSCSSNRIFWARKFTSTIP